MGRMTRKGEVVQLSQSRRCMQCGRTYARRNKQEMWVRDRSGCWVKIIANICAGRTGSGRCISQSTQEGWSRHDIRHYVPVFTPGQSTTAAVTQSSTHRSGRAVEPELAP